MSRARFFRAGALKLMLVLAGISIAGAASAQTPPEIPTVISPLRVEPDANGVNLVDGKINIDMPVLSIPAAPNLRFDRVQNAAPYVSGNVADAQVEGNSDSRSVSAHSGGEASESFSCFDYDCHSVIGSGSAFVVISNTYRQAGSGIVYHFTNKHVHTTGTHIQFRYYAANAVHPNGETITYHYQTATMTGDPIPNRTFYRPDTVTSSTGYQILLTYQGSDFNADPTAWGTVSQATLVATAAPSTPLARLTYLTSGGVMTVTDLGGRVFTCTGCTNTLGLDLETVAGSGQLPGDTAPNLQVTANGSGAVVAAVTRNGVATNYAYTNLHQASGRPDWLYDRLTVTGPNGLNNIFDLNPGSTTRNIINQATDSLGRATHYYYDESFRPVRIVAPELNEVQITYDAHGNISRRLAQAKPNSGLADIIQTADFLADTCFGVMCYRPSWTRDALNRQTDYEYNSLGQLIEQRDPADASGVRRRTSITYTVSPGNVPAGGHVRGFEYNDRTGKWVAEISSTEIGSKIPTTRYQELRQ